MRVNLLVEVVQVYRRALLALEAHPHEHRRRGAADNCASARQRARVRPEQQDWQRFIALAQSEELPLAQGQGEEKRNSLLEVALDAALQSKWHWPDEGLEGGRSQSDGRRAEEEGALDSQELYLQ